MFAGDMDADDARKRRPRRPCAHFSHRNERPLRVFNYTYYTRDSTRFGLLEIFVRLRNFGRVPRVASRLEMSLESTAVC